MAQDIPNTAKQWNVTTQDGKDGFNALQFSEKAVPDVGDSQVLVKLHAASLNYRDLIITLGKYPFHTIPDVVPGSDGAGTVIAIGQHVTRFKPGDKVVTLFNQEHIGGPVNAEASRSGLGGAIHGTLRSVGAFNEQGLVRMPENLTPVEAATLPCAGLTAWNALFGLADNQVVAGQWVLTQGTGGVSIFALQFAKAAGAKVIATTGSNEKATVLKELGADHVINYNETPDWGAVAKNLTGGIGVDHVVEVAGPKSMAQSLAAIKISGVVTIIGFVGGHAKDQPGFLDCLTNLCTVRGILVGSRAQMEDMCRAIEANPERLRPVVDKKLFRLEEVKDAYEYQWSGKHFGKVCVQIE
ncbi:Zinc-type alcohol dehydrogenase-like protein [Tolypocladium paradoxum]|uniref:Zinc-type alcohol dehydrogenase-like protein n=1 Tax=Tolypocladium paradoxum TaxID=94208 RepID=A0A2S4L3K2_9HYPO|nr:Zinc-type alcohol dehydrogenase-like protein [Tolypocladium paradoxum]